MIDPNNSLSRRCGECRWFGHNDDAQENADYQLDPRGRTNCRRFPPGYQGYSLVPADGPACGEFLAKPGFEVPTVPEATERAKDDSIPLSELPF